MRLLAAIFCLGIFYSSHAQQINLTSLQHALRWQDEMRFPAFVKDSANSADIIAYVISALSKKFNAEVGTRPAGISYRVIEMFGTPHLVSPAKSSNPKDYQASVLSFITRGTSNQQVYWEMSAEVKQNGKSVFSREIRHELVNFEGHTRWVDDSSFKQHFSMFIDELLELCPPLAAKLVLGNKSDPADLLRTDVQIWKVSKNTNVLGFALPAFGPYTTIDAGKLDSDVIRTRKVIDNESSIGLSGSKGLSFDQYKTIATSKRKFGFTAISTGSDTLVAIYSINTTFTGSRRTFLSELLSKDEEETNTSSGSSSRYLKGMVRIDTLTWEFVLGSQSGNRITSGYIENSQTHIPLIYNYHSGNHYEMISLAENGEYLASLDFLSSGTELRIRNVLDPATVKALVVLYAVMLSARNAN
ncbi:MAG TPA: hypothetical protein VK166_15450 [Chitinophagaceae bacterium]|nr:hypothetical protein [Chitinophagaceae bacterium]